MPMIYTCPYCKTEQTVRPHRRIPERPDLDHPRCTYCASQLRIGPTDDDDPTALEARVVATATVGEHHYLAALDRPSFTARISRLRSDGVWWQINRAVWWNGALELREGSLPPGVVEALSADLRAACVAAPGRKPQAFSTLIPWQEIHTAAMAVDRVRGELGRLEGPGDAWGGTYWGAGYEREGLAGLVRLSNGAETIARQTWRKIHRVCTQASGAPTDDQLHEVRRAVATALALHELRRLVSHVGVTDYGKRQLTICEQRGGRLAITGLAWLAGLPQERSEDPAVEACEAFAAGGPLDVKALWP